MFRRVALIVLLLAAAPAYAQNFVTEQQLANVDVQGVTRAVDVDPQGLSCTAGAEPTYRLFFNGTGFEACSCVASAYDCLGISAGGFTNFTAAGDSGGGQLIGDGNTLSILGTSQGITTVDSATDTVTISFVPAEVGAVTWLDNADRNWTWDIAAGGTNPVMEFSDDTINIQTGDLGINQASPTRPLHVTGGARIDLASGGPYGLELRLDHEGTCSSGSEVGLECLEDADCDTTTVCVGCCAGEHDDDPFLIFFNSAATDETGRVDGDGDLSVVDEDGTDIVGMNRNKFRAWFSYKVTAVTDFALRGSVGADEMFDIYGDGTLGWRPAGGGQDTNLYRDSANVLMTDDAFTTGALLTSGNKLTVNTVGAGTVVAVNADTGGMSASQAAILITTDNDDDATWNPFQIRDDSGVANDLLFEIDHTGQITTGILDADLITTGTIPADRAGTDHIDTLTEIAAALKSGTAGTTLATTSAAGPTPNECVEMDSSGDLVLAGNTCALLGPGGASAWSDLTAPSGDLTLAMADNNTQFTWNSAAVQVAESYFRFNLEEDSTSGSGAVHLWTLNRSNSTGTNDVTSLMHLQNLDSDVGATVVNAIRVESLAGGITNALNANDAQITNVLVTTGSSLTHAELDSIDGNTGATGNPGLLVHNASPTIVTPTIASFANAAHDHVDAAGGGLVGADAIQTATLSQIALGVKSTTADNASDVVAVFNDTIPAGANECVEMNSSGQMVVTGSACGGGAGDVTDVGAGCATGACWTDTVLTSGTELLRWEGTTSNALDFFITVPVDPGASINWIVANTAAALTFPAGTDTVVARDSTDSLTNKTITDASNSINATQLTSGTVPQLRVGNDHTAEMSEIAALIKRGPDATDTHILTTDVAAPGALTCLNMDTDGSVVLAAGACAAAGGGDVSDVGPGCATGACLTDGVTTTGGTLLVWEGTADDTAEFTIAVPSNPGADILWTVPDSVAALTFPSGTDTIVARDSTDTLTAKTLAAVSNLLNLETVAITGIVADEILVGVTGPNDATYFALAECDAAGEAMQYTNGGTFGCNTTITAAAVPWDGITASTADTDIAMADFVTTIDFITPATSVQETKFLFSVDHGPSTDAAAEQLVGIKRINASDADPWDSLLQFDNLDILGEVTNAIEVRSTGAGDITNVLHIVDTNITNVVATDNYSLTMLELGGIDGNTGTPTGTGAVVFDTSPTIVTPVIAATGWTTANHAHIAADSGGLIGADAIQTATLTQIALGVKSTTADNAGDVLAVFNDTIPAGANECVEMNSSGQLVVTGTACGSGGGAFIDADPIIANTTTFDLVLGDGVGGLTGKVEIGGDDDQPQLVIEGNSGAQADDVIIMRSDAGAERFTVGNTGRISAESITDIDGTDWDMTDAGALTVQSIAEIDSAIWSITAAGLANVSQTTIFHASDASLQFNVNTLDVDDDFEISVTEPAENDTHVSISIDAEVGIDDTNREIIKLETTSSGVVDFEVGGLDDANIAAGDVTFEQAAAGLFTVTGPVGNAGVVLPSLAVGFTEMNILAAIDGVSGVTSNNSGLETAGTDALAILQGCAANEVLKWEASTADEWGCAADADSGGAPAWSAVTGPAAVDQALTMDDETTIFTWQSASTEAAEDYWVFALDHNSSAGDAAVDLVTIRRTEQTNNQDVEALLVLENLDTAAPLDAALRITSAGGVITDGINASGSGFTNAMNIGANPIISGANDLTIGSTASTGHVFINDGTTNDFVFQSTDPDIALVDTTFAGDGGFWNVVCNDDDSCDMSWFMDARGNDTAQEVMHFDGQPADAALNDDLIFEIHSLASAGGTDANIAIMEVEFLDDGDATDTLHGFTLQMTMSSDSADAGDLFFGQRIQLLNNAGAVSPMDAGLLIENLDATAGSMTDGIRIASSGGAGVITNAFTASGGNIDNALAIGSNNITTTASTIASTELDLLDTMTAKTGADLSFVTGTAGSDTHVAEWNTDGDLISTGLATPTGAFVGTTDTQTLTGKTYDAEGTGNVLTMPFTIWMPAAGCNNATAGPIWDIPATNGAAAACVTGTNTQKGVLDFDTTTEQSAQQTFMLPSDFTGTVDVEIVWNIAAITGTVAWDFGTVCVADLATDDPAFNTPSTTGGITVPGTTLQLSMDTITTVTITGCAAGELMHMRIARDVAVDTAAGDARLLGVNLTYRRAM